MKAVNEENYGGLVSKCEIYEWEACYFKVTQICDMKSHTETKHETQNVIIWHVKVDRNNYEVMDKSEHWKHELFPMNK